MWNRPISPSVAFHMETCHLIYITFDLAVLFGLVWTESQIKEDYAYAAAFLLMSTV